MKYYINEDETKIITKDDEGQYDFFEELDFSEESEEEEIKPVEKVTKPMGRPAGSIRPYEGHGGTNGGRPKTDNYSKKQQVLDLLAQGVATKEIARSLNIDITVVYNIKSQAKRAMEPTGKIVEKPIQPVYTGDRTDAWLAQQIKKMWVEEEIPSHAVAKELNISMVKFDQLRKDHKIVMF